MDIISYKWGQLGELTSHKFHDKRIHNAVKNLHQLTQHHLTYKNTQNLFLVLYNMYTQYYLLFKIKSDLSEDIKGQRGDRTRMNKFEGYPTCQT